MQANGISRHLRSFLIMALGCFIYAVSVAVFLDPRGLAPGGVTGVSIMLSYATHIPTGTLVLLINIPLLAVGVWKFGRQFLYYTAFSTVLSSLMMNALAGVSVPTEDQLLAGIVGGALMGLGMGLVFTQGGTTGGSDIIVKLLRIKFRYLKTGVIFALTDIVIVTISAFVFKNIENGLYAAISLAVQTVIFDLVLYGPDEAKSLVIISDNARTVAGRLMNELGVGVTYLSGRGAYSEKDKLVILCAMRKQLFPQARTIVKEEDPAAFMIVSNANEIFGEGFKDHFGEEI